MLGSLYIVATPIGNLEDITLRALRLLGEVDFILCEDTRVTKKLLTRYEIKKPLISYHQQSSVQKSEEIAKLLKDGKNLALVTDAGTPGICDPGNELVAFILKKLGHTLPTGMQAIKIYPIPGPSAITTAVSISGMQMSEFLFLGYPPVKNKRNKFFGRVAASDTSVIIYESVHRIVRTLGDLKNILNGSENIVVARELTKKFETIYRGNIDEIIKELKDDKIKGEFVIIIGKN